MKPLGSKYNISAPSLGFGYLATIARKNDFLVDLIDTNKKNISWKEFSRLIKKKRYEFILIQMYSFEYYMVQEQSQLIKKIIPDSVIILGGPHPSGMPKETLRSLHSIDFLFQGEAEIGLNKFLNLTKRKYSTSNLRKIPNLVWRNGEEIICNEKVHEKDIDKIGFPAWDIIEPNKYRKNVHGIFSKSNNIAPILTNRGCIHDCVFCMSKLVNGYPRYRTAKNVISEMKLIYNRYGIKEIQIEDENFLAKKDIAIKMCKNIIHSNLKIKWTCPNGIRIENIDKKLVQLMEKSGCYSFNIGIESGNQKRLDMIKKRLDLKILEEKINLIKKYSSIKVIGSFLLGFPGETIKEINNTVSFSKKISIKRALFYCVLPYPGTEVWKEYINKEKLDWKDFKFYNFISINNNISDKQLKILIRKAYISFYMRLKILIPFILDIRKISQISNILIRVKRIIF
jgi:radical SAM superfamily enzyme YgiQ (UPF0313 family)